MTLPPIDHLFVLVLENRSFDHVFGARPGLPPPTHVNVDDDGISYQQERLDDAHARRFLFDPPHCSEFVAMQLADDMGGFVKAFKKAHPNLSREEAARVMRYFGREHAPVSNFLADHFSISDRWFSCIPTGTVPNRLYAMCGHSHGDRDNPHLPKYAWGYNVKDSIFQQLDKRGLPWRVYSGTIPPWASMIHDLRWQLYGRRGRLSSITKLKEHLDALSEETAHTFPNLVWLEPSYSWTEFKLVDPFYLEPNCDHPPGDTLRAQALMEYVYDALRRSAIWKRSALVIFYDEHGGFYDHVQPPPCQASADGFATRGPRVPAIVVSPYVKPGAIVRPGAGLCFDHCSVLKFLCERFDIAPWSTRLLDPSTASLHEFFDANLDTAAGDTGLGLYDENELRIDLRWGENDFNWWDHDLTFKAEQSGMRALCEHISGKLRRFADDLFDDG